MKTKLREEVSNAIRQYLDDNQHSYIEEKYDHSQSFRCYLETAGVFKDIKLIFDVYSTGFTIEAYSPIGIEPRNKAFAEQLRSFLSEVNCTEIIGNFCFNASSGEINYKVFADCEDLSPSQIKEMVGRWFHRAHTPLTQHAKGIIHICTGGTAEEASKICEQEERSALDWLEDFELEDFEPEEWFPDPEEEFTIRASHRRPDVHFGKPSADEYDEEYEEETGAETESEPETESSFSKFKRDMEAWFLDDDEYDFDEDATIPQIPEPIASKLRRSRPTVFAEYLCHGDREIVEEDEEEPDAMEDAEEVEDIVELEKQEKDEHEDAYEDEDDEDEDEDGNDDDEDNSPRLSPEQLKENIDHLMNLLRDLK